RWHTRDTPNWRSFECNYLTSAPLARSRGCSIAVSRAKLSSDGFRDALGTSTGAYWHALKTSRRVLGQPSPRYPSNQLRQLPSIRSTPSCKSAPVVTGSARQTSPSTLPAAHGVSFADSTAQRCRQIIPGRAWSETTARQASRRLLATKRTHSQMRSSNSASRISVPPPLSASSSINDLSTCATETSRGPTTDRPTDLTQIRHHKTGAKGWVPLEDEEGPLFPELEAYLSKLPRLG